MTVGKRRGDMEIIRDILRAEQGRTIELRYSVNLSHTLLQRYLVFLEHRYLVTLERRGSRIITFQLTDRGRKFLELLERVFLMLEPNARPGAGTGQAGLA